MCCMANGMLTICKFLFKVCGNDFFNTYMDNIYKYTKIKKL